MRIEVDFTNQDDRSELEFALRGRKYWESLWDIHSYIRNKLKYGDITEGEENLLKEIKDLIPYGVLEHD